MANTDRRSTVQSLDRGLEILKVFSLSAGPVGITDLSKNLGLAKGTISRLVKTFVEHGYLIKDPVTSKYQLSMRIWELANRATVDRNIIEIARPVIRELHSKIQETIHISVMNKENKMVFLEVLESNRDIRPNVQVGGNLPPYCVANGKAVLAFMPETEIKQILRGKLHKYTEKTITQSSRIYDALEDIRGCGYALNFGEFRADVSGIAVPIRDYTGLAVAALGISIPTSRLSVELIDNITPLIVEAGNDISSQLGHHNDENRLKEIQI